MKYIKKILLHAKDFLFPYVCALCGQNFIDTDEILYGLCKKCASSLSLSEESKCNFCGKPLISEKEMCLSCRAILNSQEAGSSINRMWVIYPYTGKYRRLLTEYKFNKNLVLANFFAQKARDVLYGSTILNGACIVPVPPRPGKIKASGWDQVETLVRTLEKTDKNLSVSRCLKRRESKAQKRLNRNERVENLKGRIYLNGKTPENALIIDDVITTGSTMEVCADVLKSGGTQNVYGLCLFYD